MRSTALGLRVKDGVVLAAEKLLVSKMLVPGTNRRIHTVDRHCGLVPPPPQGWETSAEPERAEERAEEREEMWEGERGGREE